MSHEILTSFWNDNNSNNDNNYNNNKKNKNNNTGHFRNGFKIRRQPILDRKLFTKVVNLPFICQPLCCCLRPWDLFSRKSAKQDQHALTCRIYLKTHFYCFSGRGKSLRVIPFSSPGRGWYRTQAHTATKMWGALIFLNLTLEAESIETVHDIQAATSLLEWLLVRQINIFMHLKSPIHCSSFYSGLQLHRSHEL